MWTILLFKDNSHCHEHILYSPEVYFYRSYNCFQLRNDAFNCDILYIFSWEIKALGINGQFTKLLKLFISPNSRQTRLAVIPVLQPKAADNILHSLHEYIITLQIAPFFSSEILLNGDYWQTLHWLVWFLKFISQGNVKPCEGKYWSPNY